MNLVSGNITNTCSKWMHSCDAAPTVVTKTEKKLKNTIFLIENNVFWFTLWWSVYYSNDRWKRTSKTTKLSKHKKEILSLASP